MTGQRILTLEPKLQPQLRTDVQVSRTALLELLDASSQSPVAAIIAPPGYMNPTGSRRRTCKGTSPPRPAC
jgi:hypothetical protein